MLVRRHCLACGNMCEQHDYSDYQWNQGSMAKCRWCVHHVARPNENRTPTGFGKALGAGAAAEVTNIHMPFDQGGRRWVAFGNFAATGAPCVVKWHRSVRRGYEDEGHALGLGSQSALDMDLRIAKKALQLIGAFNRAARLTIQLNVPQILQAAAADGRRRNCWQTQSGGPTAESEFEGQQLLVEPLLSDWAKHNSNSGWVSSHAPAWAGALSHYTWFASGGECLLCDLKGGWREVAGRPGERVPVLSDPSIHSRGRHFGPTDLAVDGINAWFASHVCSDLCAGELAVNRAAPSTAPSPADLAFVYVQAGSGRRPRCRDLPPSERRQLPCHGFCRRVCCHRRCAQATGARRCRRRPAMASTAAHACMRSTPATSSTPTRSTHLDRLCHGDVLTVESE